MAAVPDSQAQMERKANVSQLWGDDCLSDFTITIKLEAPTAAGASQPPPQEQAAASASASGSTCRVYATLPAHAAVLAQRSEYFSRMLRADMKERRTKEATFEFEEEQEAADFQRLIKLSYMPSYTKDDNGRRLSKEELLRLLVLANGYEMVWCMEECAQALRPLTNYTLATAYFRAVPEALMEEKHMRAATQEAGDAIAVKLGPVDSLWRPGPVHDPSKWDTGLVLSEGVMELPLHAIEAVLRSEELLLKSENYGFTLTLWWVMGQPGSKEERQPLFNRLLNSLHYTHMSCCFLAAITDDPWVKGSGLLPSIVTRAIWWRDAPLRELWIQLPRSRVNGTNRKSYSCTCTTHFTKAVIGALDKDTDPARYAYGARAALGVLHGFPCYVELRKSAAEYRLFLFSDYLEEDSTLDTPEGAWFGQGNDVERGFEFVFVRGHLGSKAVAFNERFRTAAGFGKSILHCSAADFVYDESGKVEVLLELQMNQHRAC